MDKGLSIMCHNSNHDSCVNAMMSQGECDDITHAMQMEREHDDVIPTS